MNDPLARVAAARVGRLATVDKRGEPHIVPIVFALDGNRIVTAVDHKPKRTTDLKRLRNIAANHRASVLVDHYDEDWSHLWWVRVDGPVEIVTAGPEFDAAIALLAAKYPQYREQPPQGPVVAVTPERVTAWEAE